MLYWWAHCKALLSWSARLIETKRSHLETMHRPRTWSSTTALQTSLWPEWLFTLLSPLPSICHEGAHYGPVKAQGIETGEMQFPVLVTTRGAFAVTLTCCSMAQFSKSWEASSNYEFLIFAFFWYIVSLCNPDPSRSWSPPTSILLSAEITGICCNA